ncbi:MAG TPA: HD domain-containing protein [Candidatus Paceibacterota bacterium]|jgi:putative hydrolase of HD superfamily|nr:HD domain-containing protein [Candidatus Paceibacterota bacterium]
MNNEAKPQPGDKEIVNFLYEVGMLAKTPRSGFQFLGSGKQSVAEHVNRVAFIGYTLAMLEDGVDVGKVLKMCLFHDIAEGRVSDLNYVNQKYVHADDERAIDDMAHNLPFEDDVRKTIGEYEKRESRESVLVKEADILELMLTLKEELDIGNVRAQNWLDRTVKRLKTENGKRLAAMLLRTDSDEWWFADKEDSWWVNRNKSE